MRALWLLAFIASPAFAQDMIRFDDALLPACLDRVAQEHARTDVEGDPRRACIGQAATACMQDEGGHTTVGMVECLGRETAQWDKLLNDRYARALSAFQANDAELKTLGSAAPPAAPVLQQAQRHWIAYRDKSCEFEALRYQGGTAGGPASAGCMLDLTAGQALRLMDILGTGE